MKLILHPGNAGESEVSKWRGQTVSAYLAFDGAKERATQESQRHLVQLRGRLEDWLGGRLSNSLSASLMDNVILRAYKALDMVSCSSKTYIIGSPPIPPGPVDEQADHFHIKDMVSWQSIPSRRAVDLLQCLHPGVMRMGESGQDHLLLVQPTWLGYEESGHLPRASRPSSAAHSPSDRKHSKRQGDRKLPWMMSWFPIPMESSWGSTMTRSRKVIPKTVAVVDPLPGRGTPPGYQQASDDHRNLQDQYAYRTHGPQLSPYGDLGYENHPNANDEGSSRDHGHEFRRSSTR